MTLRTKHDVKVAWQHGTIPYTVTVPANTPVRSAGYHNQNGPMYWAENLRSFLKPGSIEILRFHPSKHIGRINLNCAIFYTKTEISLHEV